MAHKKGVGSSKNGRDSESKRLGVKKFGGEQVLAGNIIVRQNSTPATMLVSVKMTHCLLSSMVKFNSNPTEETENKLAFTLYKIKTIKKAGCSQSAFFYDSVVLYELFFSNMRFVFWLFFFFMQYFV